MTLDQIRAIGEIYRLIVNQSPLLFPKGHEFKAAQRPLIYLNRAVETVTRVTTIDPFVTDILQAMTSAIPTDAVGDILYEEQQNAFLLGYNTKHRPSMHVRGLRAVRLSRGMSQEDLAKKMGIHRSQISDYERNIRNYGIDTLRLFCTALNCSADDIVNVN